MVAARLSPGELARLSSADRSESACSLRYKALKDAAFAHLAALKERALDRRDTSRATASGSAIVAPRSAATVSPPGPSASDDMDIFDTKSSAPISLAADSPPDSPTLRPSVTKPVNNHIARAINATHCPSSYSAAVTDTQSTSALAHRDWPLATSATSATSSALPPRNRFMEVMNNNRQRRLDSQSASQCSSSYLSSASFNDAMDN